VALVGTFFHVPEGSVPIAAAILRQDPFRHWYFFMIAHTFGHP
jgi:hypothetical protein